MLARDVPDGPWQDMTADYMTHKCQEYLIICDAFSKYPFVFKVNSKSAQSLCTCLLELTSQYGPPSTLSTDNGPPFSSEELTEFLMHHHIEHSTFSPHFPRSNGFIEQQVRTIQTVLNTILPSKKPLETVLPDLWSALIGPNMPSPWEILHNRAFQWLSKPLQPVNMENVRNFLLSHKQNQCNQFNKAHGAHTLPKLPRPRGSFQVPYWQWVHTRHHTQQGYHAEQLLCRGPRQEVPMNKGTHMANPYQFAPSSPKTVSSSCNCLNALALNLANT